MIQYLKLPETKMEASLLFSSTIKPVRLNSNIFTYELNKLGSCLRFGIKDNPVRKLLT